MRASSRFYIGGAFFGGGGNDAIMGIVRPGKAFQAAPNAFGQDVSARLSHNQKQERVSPRYVIGYYGA
jgi:hypothetical protein